MMCSSSYKSLVKRVLKKFLLLEIIGNDIVGQVS